MRGRTIAGIGTADYSKSAVSVDRNAIRRSRDRPSAASFTEGNALVRRVGWSEGKRGRAERTVRGLRHVSLRGGNVRLV